MQWIGPFTINELLDNFSKPIHLRPPTDRGVYIISRKSWHNKPTSDCEPLYIGSNTGGSKRFRTRVGDLIADMFGFFSSETGHHSGGQSLFLFCKKNNVNPKDLYIGWIKNCNCVRCAENEIYERFRPSLNRNRPAQCKKH